MTVLHKMVSIRSESVHSNAMRVPVKKTDYAYADIVAAAEWIQSRVHNPKLLEAKIAIVLGSGLSDLMKLEDVVTIPYGAIQDHCPFFPTSTNPAHMGNMLFGFMKGIPIIVFNGRWHRYEGHKIDAIAFPYRVLRELMGPDSTMLLTSAVGGVQGRFDDPIHVGDLMLIQSFMDFSGGRGNTTVKVIPEQQPYPFTGTNRLYTKELRDMVVNAAIELDDHTLPTATKKPFKNLLHPGELFYRIGPTFESAAEVADARTHGTKDVAKALSMSGMPEALICNAMGMKVLHIAGVTNVGVDDPDAQYEPTDGEVKDNMKEIIVPRLAELLDSVIPRIS